jgi:hypothetical protein
MRCDIMIIMRWAQVNGWWKAQTDAMDAGCFFAAANYCKPIDSSADLVVSFCFCFRFRFWLVMYFAEQ